MVELTDEERVSFDLPLEDKEQKAGRYQKMDKAFRPRDFWGVEVGSELARRVSLNGRRG